MICHLKNNQNWPRRSGITENGRADSSRIHPSPKATSKLAKTVSINFFIIKYNWDSNENHNSLLFSKIALWWFQPFGLPREVQHHLENFYERNLCWMFWFLLQIPFLLFTLLHPHEAVLQMDSINWVPSSWIQPLRVNDRRMKNKKENRSRHFPPLAFLPQGPISSGCSSTQGLADFS